MTLQCQTNVETEISTLVWLSAVFVNSKKRAHHIHDISHSEDEDGSHGPGVASPAGVVNPHGERHKLLGKDLTQKKIR